MILTLVFALVTAAPAWAGDPSAVDANYADGSSLGEFPGTLALTGAPLLRDLIPSQRVGVPTPWGYLDVSLSETPTSLPFRLRLDPRPELSSTESALAVVPYVALGRTDRLDTELPDNLRNLTQDRTRQLKTAAGLSWLLGQNAEFSGEYHFAGIGRPGLSLDTDALGRTVNTSPESLGFSLNLSIRY